jgi:hypothetical protein
LQLLHKRNIKEVEVEEEEEQSRKIQGMLSVYFHKSTTRLKYSYKGKE